MSNTNGDINDDEIRIISSGSGRKHDRGHKGRVVWLCVVAAVLIVGVSAIFFMSAGEAVVEESSAPIAEAVESTDSPAAASDTLLAVIPYVARQDTVVDGVKLIILTPENATPSLEMGNEVANDSSVVLMAQAADVRADNGEIAGSFVLRGELISKGEAKAGYCSIVNGVLSVGVADATPALEQALVSDGYFFRQYPLVVGGQVVKNKPKGKALRKALVEMNGGIKVVLSENKVSFLDFSQALVDIGARNAIYLVGGSSYGRYTDADGEVYSFGLKSKGSIGKVNYLVWR